MPNVLVVDDTSLDRELVTSLLQRNPGLSVEAVDSGAAALNRLESSSLVDLVVTDLTMPEMNGLELVTAVRVRFPQVPVILATANGSELLAIAALEQGATSYVPKAQLADRLLDTVEKVLTHSRAQLDTEKLMQSLTYADLRFTLDPAEAVFDQLVSLVQQVVASVGMCEPADEIRLGMTLEETLRDVLLRGSLGLNDEQVQAYQFNRSEARALVAERLTQVPYRDRRIFVEVRVSSDEARFQIRHDGEPHALPGNEVFQSPHLLERPECRAYVLINSFLDEFDVDAEGRCLTLVKRR
ncbi:MAG: response regulator [Planctomycetaceae bacterium]|nr:response regulator [Planctomycetales bacterium]MCB9924182.1 response regulator [Planctomycetaceae bacterium]